MLSAVSTEHNRICIEKKTLSVQKTHLLDTGLYLLCLHDATACFLQFHVDSFFLFFFFNIVLMWMGIVLRMKKESLRF